MIRSMTAFASAEYKADWGTIRVELRSVNHRYLDLSFKLPEHFVDLEFHFRQLLREKLNRGKVDCILHFEENVNATCLYKIAIDPLLVEQLGHAINEVSKKIVNVPVNGVSPLEILKWPKVIRSQDLDFKLIRDDIQSLFRTVVSNHLQERQREGLELKHLIEQRLTAMKGIVGELKKRVPELLVGYRERLLSKLSELKSELDNHRLEQEMIYIANKIDITEELDRFSTHVHALEKLLTEEGIVGRHLDFLLQELNREANTLTSKSIDSRTTSLAVELKVLIEQIREQAQNIE